MQITPNTPNPVREDEYYSELFSFMRLFRHRSRNTTNPNPAPKRSHKC